MTNANVITNPTRRNALALTASGMVAALTGTVAAKADTAPAIPADLTALVSKLDAAFAELAAAIEAKEWTIAEWRHVWPLAPEEILGGANASLIGYWGQDAETDMAGDLVMRNRADLTKRLARKFREEGGQTAFYLDRADDLAERLAEARKRTITAKTEKGRARQAKEISAYIKRLETALPLAREYEAETARVRKASGIEAVLQRIEMARAAIIVAMCEISHHSATGPEAARVKAEAIEKWLSVYGRNDPQLDMLATAQWTRGVLTALTA